MDKIERYRQYILQLLTDKAKFSLSNKDIETQTIFDTKHDHYQLVHAGWQNQRRIYGCFLHLDLKDGKVWIQHNGTEIDIARELVDLGVDKKDIVLAFHDPFMRQFTEYAVN